MFLQSIYQQTYYLQRYFYNFPTILLLCYRFVIETCYIHLVHLWYALVKCALQGIKRIGQLAQNQNKCLQWGREFLLDRKYNIVDMNMHVDILLI